MVIRVTLSHVIALVLGAALALSAAAFAGNVRLQSAPTHADMARINLNERIFKLCASRLAFAIDDPADRQAWCG